MPRGRTKAHALTSDVRVKTPPQYITSGSDTGKRRSPTHGTCETTGRRSRQSIKCIHDNEHTELSQPMTWWPLCTHNLSFTLWLDNETTAGFQACPRQCTSRGTAQSPQAPVATSTNHCVPNVTWTVYVDRYPRRQNPGEYAHRHQQGFHARPYSHLQGHSSIMTS